VGVFSKSESEREDMGRNVGNGEAKPDVKVASAKTAPETVSTLGHGVLVTGNIVSENTLQIFGRVNGDIHASHLIIKEAAQVEGNVVAQETIILGICKGVIHGNSVKLQGTAVVEGEIYSKSLTIEQQAQFEGVSRRLDKPVEAPLSAQTTLPAKIPLAPSIREAAPAIAPAEKMTA
jgi:cytoskeletal protein CcmA (bactofilin family)